MTAQERRQAFAAMLKQARETKGLSQRQLADLVGLSPGAVGHMETGRVGGKEDTVKALEDVLDLDQGDLGGLLGHTDVTDWTTEAAIKADRRIPPAVKRYMIAGLAAFEPQD